MGLQNIVDQLLYLNVNSFEEITSVGFQMDAYIQNLNAEVQRKSSLTLTAEELRSRGMYELSHRLQMLENSNTRMFESLIKRIQEIQEKSGQSLILLLLASVSAIKSPIISAKTKALDGFSSFEIASVTLAELEKDKYNACNEPLDVNGTKKGINQTCRELGQLSNLCGLEYETPRLWDANKGGAQIENLNQFAVQLTNNPKVAARFVQRTNADGFLAIFNLYLRGLLGKNSANTEAFIKNIKLDNKEYEAGKFYNDGTKEIKNNFNFEKYDSSIIDLQNTSAQQDLRFYSGADGVIYVRALVIYDKVLGSDGTQFARKDGQPLFYNDVLFRIDADKETIVSSRVIPNDPIAYPLLGIDKNQVVQRKSITAVIAQEKLTAKNKKIAAETGVNPEALSSASITNSAQEVARFKAKFETENNVFHKIRKEIGDKLSFFADDVPKHEQEVPLVAKKQTWMNPHPTKTAGATIDKTASDNDSDDESRYNSFRMGSREKNSN